MLSFISPSSNFAPQANNNNNNNNNKNNKNNNHNHNNTDKFPVKNMFFRVLEPPQAQYIQWVPVVGGDWGVEIIGNSGFGLGLWTTLWKAQGLFFPSSKMDRLG